LALFGLNSKVLINYHQDFIGIITNNLTTTPQMMSFGASTPLEFDASASQASATTSGTPLPDALARMMARLPAMSSECERLFSSCAKQTTPERLKSIRRDVGASGMPVELAPARSYQARTVLGCDSISLINKAIYIFNLQ
jgi:hypothetical protein